MSYPILFESTERDFTSQGFGVLSDALTCKVTEERNSSYELEMTYPITGVHFSDISYRRFLFVKPNYTDNPQAFRIYKITKPLNGVCTIYAEHISYDMSGLELPQGLSASSLGAACELLNKYASPFTIKATKEVTADFNTDVPASVRSWLGGKTGSIIDVYTGEWHWDMFTATLSNNRGENRGVTMRYGKNLISLEQEEACSNLYTAIRPYWQGGEDSVVVTGDLFDTGLTLDIARVYFLDCSNQFDDEPTVEQLNSYAETYAKNNNFTTPEINLTLDFVQMKPLAERVDICDTVTIEFEKLGVSATAKCIKTVWDCLKEQYTSTTFGDSKHTIADTILDTVEAIEDAKVTSSQLEAAATRASEKITGNRGGYVVIHDSDGDGHPDEILIMDTDSIDTATKVWRWNKEGLGYSSTGYDGTYGLAMTSDGEIVADYITTGTLSADRIYGGTLKIGGKSNVNGVLEIYDSNNKSVGKWTYSSLTVGDNFELLSDGTLTMKNGVITLTDDNDNSLFELNRESDTGGAYIHMGDQYNNDLLQLSTTTRSSAIMLKDYSLGTTILITNIERGPSIEIGDEDGTYMLMSNIAIEGRSNWVQNLFLSGSTGAIRCVSLSQTSDEKYKKDIKDLKNSMTFIHGLRPVEFINTLDEKVHHGFVAQEVEKIITDNWGIISENEDGDKSLVYTDIIADLVAVVQNLIQRVEKLENA